MITEIYQLTKQNKLSSSLEKLLKVSLSLAQLKAIHHALSFLSAPYQLATGCHLNVHKQPLTFDDKPYLKGIYLDARPKVIQKSVQCGISEMLICTALSYAKYGFSVLYVLPSHPLRGRFVHNRIDPLFMIVPEYQKLLKDAAGESDSVMLKHFGDGVINFVGSNTVNEFIEFPADVVIIDEMNRCVQGNLSMAYDRLDASTIKHRVMVGNPTHEDFGITSAFNNTDKKAWFVSCKSCNERQPLEWLVNIAEEIDENEHRLLDEGWDEKSGREIQVFCRKCKEPIDRLGHGEWVKQNTESDNSGYHISQLYSVNTPIAELWDLWTDAQGNPTNLQVFWNSKMGLPYSPKGSRLSRSELHACTQDYLLKSGSEKQRCSMGVDVGKLLHVRISSLTSDGKRKAEYIGVVKEFSEVSALVERYKVRYAVIDMYPETRVVKDFQAQHHGVWLCKFPSNSAAVAAKVIRKDEDEQILDVDRTQAFDNLVASIRKKELILPKNAGLIADYYDQLRAPVRIYDKEKDRNSWQEGSQADHYFLAEVYDAIASQMIKDNSLVVY
tara:strand:+ start:2050 stop:3714 length:1665 start_codon:yes stop_codon:yes gene_type:complete